MMRDDLVLGLAHGALGTRQVKRQLAAHELDPVAWPISEAEAPDQDAVTLDVDRPETSADGLEREAFGDRREAARHCADEPYHAGGEQVLIIRQRIRPAAASPLPRTEWMPG